MAKDFSAAIKEIMPLVQDGDKSTPFIIYRKQNDDGAEWHVNYPYPAEKSGQAYKGLLEADPFAMRYHGADFAGGSFAYVHDKIFCDRLRVEHYDYVVCDEYSSGEQSKMRALMNFFEDNAAAFPVETLAYLAKYDLPFKALAGFCPFNMATGHEGWTFNHDLAPDAVDAIEQRVETLINTRKLTLEEPESDKSVNVAPKVQKPDLLGKINANKQKVEQYKAANKDAPAKKPKRDGQEV
jgi:hypothetical protein